MTHLKHAIAIVLCGMVLPGAIALAQDACPVAHVCVDYEGSTIILDPADGPVQAVTVKERAVTLTGFDGSSTRHQAILAVYIANGDSYEFTKEVTVDVEGQFSGAELETFYHLSEND